MTTNGDAGVSEFRLTSGDKVDGTVSKESTLQLGKKGHYSEFTASNKIPLTARNSQVLPHLQNCRVAKPPAAWYLWEFEIGKKKYRV